VSLNTQDGSGECWGEATYGGDCPSIDFNGMDIIYSTSGAFLGLNIDSGSGQCWGLASAGGDCTSQDFTEVTESLVALGYVYTTDTAFLAYNKEAGTGQCWLE
jgi:hypothetical protein